MLSVWEDKMRVLLCLLLAVSCHAADKNDNRRNKLPFIADAVGNSLPRPSSVPATVGSPVNLLTPDRYEFYTFDESGELVKRLMTLEEIQAIVAAGEEAEGLVTFANDNQPTVSFDMNQPPYTKVHSVVTNVQNVLKAQMEAHKNKPHVQPTLDTPDVSDSWSLILPSIFGNTGVDIVFDKNSGSVTPPETDTYDNNSEENESSLSKEGSNEVISSSTTVVQEKHAVTEKLPVIVETKEIPTTTTSTTTTTTTTTTTPKPTTTTRKPTTTTPKATTTTRKATTTTTQKPTTHKPTRTPPKTTITTRAPTTTTTTTKKPIATSTTTTQEPTTASTTNKPSTTTKLPVKVTNKPITTTTTSKPTTPKSLPTSTAKPEHSIKKQSVSIINNLNPEDLKVQPIANDISATEKTEIQFERISTFIPVSTANYITERIPPKPEVTTKPPIVVSTTKKSVVTTTTTTQAPTTEATKTQTFVTTSSPVISTSNYILNTLKENENDKINVTTITTQSVSPSTTVSSTEFVSTSDVNELGNQHDDDESDKDDDSLIPLFDISQSISQIASDLGGTYQPIPTTSNLLDTTKVNLLDLESKEVLDMDIPSGPSNETANDNAQSLNTTDDNSSDNFIKITTFDPHGKDENTNTSEKETEVKKIEKHETKLTVAENKETQNNESQNSEDTKNNNLIINDIKQVEFLTTTAASEVTTIDPVLSESMGDLLSQVVNEAPQSIVNSNQNTKENTKTTSTEKNIEVTTVESLETTSEVSNKVKKESGSNIEETNKESDEILAPSDNANFTASTVTVNKDEKEAEPNNTTSDASVNPDDITVSDGNKLEDTNPNFVQISVSSNKDDEKVNVTTETKTNPVTSEKTSEIKEEVLIKQDIKPDENKSKNGNKTTITETKQFETVETINKPEDTTKTTTTAAPIKITQSKLNKINAGDKTNKNSEPLPKVELSDFKKKIQKVNDEEELVSERNNSWKLIPTLSPPKVNEIPKDKVKSDSHFNPDSVENKDVVLEFSTENQGLEVTTRDLGEDVTRFSELSNELAFRFWNVMIDEIDKKRSFVLSPYSVFSMLAMIFMGARGATSGEMNEILKLDDMVTFNPHFTLKNISDSIETTPESGVAISAFMRELYSDRNKGKILTFYKERAQHFYNGHVEEINFKLISDIIRRRTNLLVKRYTWGKIPEYMKTNNIVMQPPLAAFTANIFETDCTGTSVEGRDGEMYFVVSPNVRQRRLVPVPAVVYKSGFLAGYDPALDATVAALGNTNTVVSTLFLMPGQQGNVVHADDLEKLEERLLDAIPTTPTWNRVLRSLLPRTGLELQIPRFSHKSTFNISSSLRKMGLKDLFDGDHADLGGLNGPSKDLYLSDMVQLNTFVTCGEGAVGEQHHIEEYPDTLSVSQRRRTRWLNDWDEPRDYQRAFHDPHDVGDAMHLPLHLRPRQARVPARSSQPARLKFDRPFLYFVRHNPSGMILYFGRFNPRLLP
ncbi:unnamed protein product [Chrysodeixis includens]|uniref:Serpin domain-containing protein n=1 Tax=Chrysodeixis includens TaxID=689277 RepID=A0A9P0BQA2_CHRIL|nr:unnamed protein product [Chrysodeixis includens]